MEIVAWVIVGAGAIIATLNSIDLGHEVRDISLRLKRSEEALAKLRDDNGFYQMVRKVRDTGAIPEGE